MCDLRFHIRGQDGAITWYWSHGGWDMDKDERARITCQESQMIRRGIINRNRNMHENDRIHPVICLEEM